MSRTKKLTLYHEASRGGFKQWSIWREGATVTVEWGLVGGNLQTSSDTTKSKGKPGTKGYKDEQTCAHENYERQVRHKREEGYRETMDSAEEADWLMGLDKTFVPAKPIAGWDRDDFMKARKGAQWYVQRKRDGRRHLVLKDRKGKIHIYSRRIEDLTEHLRDVVTAKALANVPNGTILDGEIIIDNKTVDDFKAVGRFTNPATDPADARKTAAQYNVRFMVFDVLYHAGEPVWQEFYGLRHAMLRAMLDETVDSRVFPVENIGDEKSLIHWMDVATKMGWEGLVVWDALKPSFVRRGGKPKRVNAMKWKPKQEFDLVATGFFYGSGNLSKVAGGLLLSAYDEKGNTIDCGRVGTGFDDELRRDILTWEFPCAVSIECDHMEDTGKLRFPVFLKRHEDKEPNECIIEIPEE